MLNTMTIGIARSDMRSSSIAQRPAMEIVQQLSANLFARLDSICSKKNILSNQYTKSLFQTITVRRYL